MLFPHKSFLGRLITFTILSRVWRYGQSHIRFITRVHHALYCMLVRRSSFNPISMNLRCKVFSGLATNLFIRSWLFESYWFDIPFFRLWVFVDHPEPRKRSLFLVNRYSPGANTAGKIAVFSPGSQQVQKVCWTNWAVEDFYWCKLSPPVEIPTINTSINECKFSSFYQPLCHSLGRQRLQQYSGCICNYPVWWFESVIKKAFERVC